MTMLLFLKPTYAHRGDEWGHQTGVEKRKKRKKIFHVKKEGETAIASAIDADLHRLEFLYRAREKEKTKKKQATNFVLKWLLDFFD